MDITRLMAVCGAMVLSAGVAFAQPTTPTPVPAGTGTATPAPGMAEGPRMVLEMQEHDFGRLYSREPVSVMLRFKNAGNAPLEIQKVNTSCGCTTTKLEKMVYEPGESGEIEVIYRPKGPGASTAKMVTIQCNDPTSPVAKFTIRGTLIEPAVLEPERLQLGQIRTGDSAEAVFTLTSPDVNIEVIEIIEERGLVEFEVRDGGKAENPMFPGRKLIVAKLARKLPGGPLQIPVKVRIRATAQEGQPPVESELQCSILGHVLGDIENEPRFLRVPVAQANTDFEVKTLVYSQSGKPFTITSTEITDSNIPNVHIEVTKASKTEVGKEGYWLTLRGNPGELKGAFRGRIHVHTDLPDEGPKLITFNGVVRAEVGATTSTTQ
jgi:hypothetical protein